jgi:hypothetical protein
VATGINHQQGYVVHLVIVSIVLLVLIFSLKYFKNNQILGLVLLALFIFYPIVQIYDPMFSAICSKTSILKLQNGYVFFTIPFLVPAVLFLFSPNSDKKQKDVLKKK